MLKLSQSGTSERIHHSRRPVQSFVLIIRARDPNTLVPNTHSQILRNRTLYLLRVQDPVRFQDKFGVWSGQHSQKSGITWASIHDIIYGHPPPPTGHQQKGYNAGIISKLMCEWQITLWQIWRHQLHFAPLITSHCIELHANFAPLIELLLWINQQE